MFGKGERIESLEGEVAGLEAERNRLSRQLDEARAQLAEVSEEVLVLRGAARVVPSLAARIQGFYNDGNIIEAATHLASEVIAAEQEPVVTAELRDRILTDRGDSLRARFRLERSPLIRERLKEEMENDGTFERTDQEVEDEMTGEVYSQLVAERKAASREELETPEAKTAFMERIRTEVAESDELATYREELRAELETEWREEANNAAKRQIREAVEGEEEEYKERAKKDYLESYSGRNLRSSLEEKLRRKWGEEAIETVASELEDELLQAILTERARLAKVKIERENKATRLLGEFTGKGLDTSTVEAGSLLEVLLGNTQTVIVTERKPNNYGYEQDQTVNKRQLTCARQLILTSQGNGRFIVNSDSLQDSSSLYEREHGLKPGMVITVGRQVSEDGQQALDPHLAADVPFFYDDDMRDPEHHTGYYPVANIKLDGIAARQFDIIEMPNQSVKTIKKR